MKIDKYSEYNYKMAHDFMYHFDSLLESKDVKPSIYKDIEKKTISDLKLNAKLIAMFGTGIGSFYPIITNLMANMPITLEITEKSVVMLTLASLTIIFLEEKKYKDAKDEEILIKDSKSMLEELRLMGIGGGIVKTIIKCIKSIKFIFSRISNHIFGVINGVIDM